MARKRAIFPHFFRILQCSDTQRLTLVPICLGTLVVAISKITVP